MWGIGSLSTETRFRYIKVLANQKCWNWLHRPFIYHFYVRFSIHKFFDKIRFLRCKQVNFIFFNPFYVCIYLYSHTAKYNGTEKNNNIIIKVKESFISLLKHSQMTWHLYMIVIVNMLFQKLLKQSYAAPVLKSSL
jgi:hypothetical protein